MAEQIFLPVRDAKMAGIPESAQTTNFGDAPSLDHTVTYAGGEKSSWHRTIVDFDVSSLAGADLTAARLVREIVSLTGVPFDATLSRCTRPGDWVEGEVTWLEYKTGFDWTNEAGDFDDDGPPAAITYTEPSTTGEHEIAGLLPFVEDALANRGGIVSLITRLAHEDPQEDQGATWRSRERPDSWRLVVEHEAAAAGHQSVPPSSRGTSSTPRAARPARPRPAASPARPTRSHR